MQKNKTLFVLKKFLVVFTMGLFFISLFPTKNVSGVEKTPYAKDFLPNLPVDDNPFKNEDGLWIISDDKQTISQSPQTSNYQTSIPDDFGYFWDDSISVEWIDATLGTHIAMNGDSQGKHTEPIAIGFDFPYYENTYSQVYIAASGFLTFDDSGSWPNQSSIPTAGEPNNVIAPYWSPLYIPTGETNGIFFLQGGEAPDRFFVVEWIDVAGGSSDDATGGDDLFHFQVILHENGDILFQYEQMQYTGSSYCGAAGIENSTGNDGLNYLPFCEPATTNDAVMFLRPDPSARVQLMPSYQSDFIQPGASHTFPISVTNLGDLGQDTFELTGTSNWSIDFLHDDSLTPLQDTNGDGTQDTGPLEEGQTLPIIIQVTAPSDLSIGTGEGIEIIAVSNLNFDEMKTINIDVAVSARFAQAFRDNADGAMSLLLSHPQLTQTTRATSNGWWGYNPAVAETKLGHFIYLWQRWLIYPGSQNLVSELEVTTLDQSGEILHPVTKLSNHSAATLNTYDEEPVIAVAPDGAIGLAWRRRIIRERKDGIQENWNIFFAVLDEAGSMTFGPINLTQNLDWYQPNPVSLGVPRYYSIRLSVNNNNEFTLIWHRKSQEKPNNVCSSNCMLDDIYYTLRNTAGEQIKPITRLTADTLISGEAYSSPTVQKLTDNRWIVVYNHSSGGMAFTILDQEGKEIPESKSFIGRSGWSPVALQPPGQNWIVIAYTAWTDENPQIHTVILDSETLQKQSETNILTNPASTTGGDFPALAADSMGHAILTWMDFSANNRRHLFYALFGQDGQIVTPPMVFKSAEEDYENTPYIGTGFSGYGLTSNRQFQDVPLEHWAAAWIERLFDTGITTGCTVDPPSFCPEETTTRAQMAVLLGRAFYDLPEGPSTPSSPNFEDVPLGYWAAPWIEQLYQDGITTGCQTDPLRFCPEENITRAEMAVFLVRIIHGQDFIPETPSGIFADVPTTHWAAGYIEQLYEDGLTTGCDTSPLRYCPEANTTRAEIAVFLGRILDIK